MSTLSEENVAKFNQRQRKVSSLARDGATDSAVTGPTIRRISRAEAQGAGGGLGVPGRRISSYGRERRLSSSDRSGGLTSRPEPVPTIVKVQNTYQMEPTTNNKFNPSRVEKVALSILDTYLDCEDYNGKKMSHLSQTLSEMIKNRVKEMNFPRYKIVCVVTIGQNCGQDFRSASRCLWDRDNDTFATVTFKNSSLFAIANVYATYFE
ncbi:unnamed protein product [Owenia fusiformis]|uniref:Uncharacterized protein n=1 Tax=Owenia fusiformis TaxID=6347 RepID=A0A8J1XPV6_OWEFU|nr:unnamed protein product [Owenia fusiformis]